MSSAKGGCITYSPAERDSAGDSSGRSIASYCSTNKERDILLRNIAIDSHDGSFHGHLVVGVSSTESLIWRGYAADRESRYMNAES